MDWGCEGKNSRQPKRAKENERVHAQGDVHRIPYTEALDQNKTGQQAAKNRAQRVDAVGKAHIDPDAPLFHFIEDTVHGRDCCAHTQGGGQHHADGH